MPPLMSFAKTVPAVEDGTKTVTRRLGWRRLKPGDRFEGVDRSPRAGKGFRRLGLFEVVSVKPVILGDITVDEIRREGVLEEVTARAKLASTSDAWHRPAECFAAAFVALFCAPKKPDPDLLVRRIEFRRVAP